jgi:hypothetical protein
MSDGGRKIALRFFSIVLTRAVSRLSISTVGINTVEQMASVTRTIALNCSLSPPWKNTCEPLPLGLGIGLFATVVVTAGTALFSSVPGMVGVVQHVPAILLSLVLAEVLVEVPEADLLPTTIAAIAVTTFSVGLVSLLLGLFNLGNVIRYVPFPVIGGFLGGTGWFLSLGAILLMTGLPEITDPALLFAPVALLQWLPGLAFALLQLWLMGRYKHPLTLPGLILTLPSPRLGNWGYC